MATPITNIFLNGYISPDEFKAYGYTTTTKEQTQYLTRAISYASQVVDFLTGNYVLKNFNNDINQVIDAKMKDALKMATAIHTAHLLQNGIDVVRGSTSFNIGAISASTTNPNDPYWVSENIKQVLQSVGLYSPRIWAKPGCEYGNMGYADYMNPVSEQMYPANFDQMNRIYIRKDKIISSDGSINIQFELDPTSGVSAPGSNVDIQLTKDIGTYDGIKNVLKEGKNITIIKDDTKKTLTLNSSGGGGGGVNGWTPFTITVPAGRHTLDLTHQSISFPIVLPQNFAQMFFKGATITGDIVSVAKSSSYPYNIPFSTFTPQNTPFYGTGSINSNVPRADNDSIGFMSFLSPAVPNGPVIFSIKLTLTGDIQATMQIDLDPNLAQGVNMVTVDIDTFSIELYGLGVINPTPAGVNKVEGKQGDKYVEVDNTDPQLPIVGSTQDLDDAFQNIAEQLDQLDNESASYLSFNGLNTPTQPSEGFNILNYDSQKQNSFSIPMSVVIEDPGHYASFNGILSFTMGNGQIIPSSTVYKVTADSDASISIDPNNYFKLGYNLVTANSGNIAIAPIYPNTTVMIEVDKTLKAFKGDGELVEIQETIPLKAEGGSAPSGGKDWVKVADQEDYTYDATNERWLAKVTPTEGIYKIRFTGASDVASGNWVAFSDFLNSTHFAGSTFMPVFGQTYGVLGFFRIDDIHMSKFDANNTLINVSTITSGFNIYEWK